MAIKYDFSKPLHMTGGRLFKERRVVEDGVSRPWAAGLDAPDADSVMETVTAADIILRALDGHAGVNDALQPIAQSAKRIGQRYAVARLIEAKEGVVELSRDDASMIDEVVRNPAHGLFTIFVAQILHLLDTPEQS